MIIAISSAHRKESLEATHYAIDAIKAKVPIWKKVNTYISHLCTDSLNGTRCHKFFCLWPHHGRRLTDPGVVVLSSCRSSMREGAAWMRARRRPGSGRGTRNGRVGLTCRYPVPLIALVKRSHERVSQSEWVLAMAACRLYHLFHGARISKQGALVLALIRSGDKTGIPSHGG